VRNDEAFQDGSGAHGSDGDELGVYGLCRRRERQLLDLPPDRFSQKVHLTAKGRMNPAFDRYPT
jgi:hypothetical protein